MTRTDVILLSHGSRAPEAREYFVQLSGLVRDLTGWPHVEPAFMELCGPSLGEAVDSCVSDGAQRIVVLPCFLHPGRHLMHDIPRLMEEAQARHLGVPLILADRIGTHVGLGRLIGDCVEEALQADSAARTHRCPGCLLEPCGHQSLRERSS